MTAYRRWLPALALLVLSLTWGYTWVIAKQGLTHAPPFAFAAERCAGGALALLVALKLSGRSLKLPAPGPTLAIALTQVAGFMMFQTWASGRVHRKRRAAQGSGGEVVQGAGRAVQ